MNLNASTSSIMSYRLVIAVLAGFAMTGMANMAWAESVAEPPDRVRVGGGTDLPIPRFVSLGSSQINLRRGPGKDYPVDWVLKKRGLPVEIIAEYEQWRRIKVMDGSEGWVHQNLLSGRRMALVAEPEVPLLNRADATAPLIARLRQGVLLQLDDCHDDAFCEVEVGDHKGFVPRSGLYGLYASEHFAD